MIHTAESIQAVLKDIQSQVPLVIRNRIVKQVELTPTIKKIAKEALDSGATKEDLKVKLRNLLDTGQLDKFKYVEDKKYSKMANDIVQRLIKKAVEQGRLPKKADINKILNEKSNN